MECIRAEDMVKVLIVVQVARAPQDELYVGVPKLRELLLGLLKHLLRKIKSYDLAGSFQA